MQSNLKPYLAFAAVCFFWGTTFLALTYALQTIPPLFLAGIRQAIAGVLICAYFWFRGQCSIPRNCWKPILINGFLLIFLSNILTTLSLKYVSSGITALLFSMVPLFVIVLNVMFGNEKANVFSISGVALGFLGLVLIYANGINLSESSFGWGFVLLLISILIWALGSVYTSTSALNLNPILMLGLQFLIYGSLMSIAGLAFEPVKTSLISTTSAFAVGYLVIFDSIIGFGAYVYAIRKLNVTLVSSYAYISPLIALFLGWLLLHETITVFIVLAAAIIIGGVFLIQKGENYESK